MDRFKFPDAHFLNGCGKSTNHMARADQSAVGIVIRIWSNRLVPETSQIYELEANGDFYSQPKSNRLVLRPTSSPDLWLSCLPQLPHVKNEIKKESSEMRPLSCPRGRIPSPKASRWCVKEAVLALLSFDGDDPIAGHPPRSIIAVSCQIFICSIMSPLDDTQRYRGGDQKLTGVGCDPGTSPGNGRGTKQDRRSVSSCLGSLSRLASVSALNSNLDLGGFRVRRFDAVTAWGKRFTI